MALSGCPCVSLGHIDLVNCGVEEGRYGTYNDVGNMAYVLPLENEVGPREADQE
jgi:hypothetical protein